MAAPRSNPRRFPLMYCFIASLYFFDSILFFSYVIAKIIQIIYNILQIKQKWGLFMSRPVQQEYAMLREEIMEIMRSQNSLSTFVSATICTFIGVVIALDSPNPLLYLIPFTVLVPAAFKEALSKTCCISGILSYCFFGKRQFLSVGNAISSFR